MLGISALMLRVSLWLLMLPTAVAAQDPSGWRVQESRAAGDSITEVTFLLTAESAPRGRTVTPRPILMIRCAKGRTELGMFTGPYPGSPDRKQTVRFRLDRLAPMLAEWNESRDGRAILHPNPRLLLHDLMITERLVFEYPNADGERVVEEFAVSGLDTLLDEAGGVCGER
jgi:hypothetical protein